MSDKGQLHGKCNRTRCLNWPAVCWSSVEQAYYCVTCAKSINEWLPSGVSPINIPQEPDCFCPPTMVDIFCPKCGVE